MHILFLEIDTAREWAVASLGPASIATHVRANGHQASMLRVAHDASVDVVVAEVRARAPDLLGISMTSRQWLRARDLVAAIRSHIDVPVIAGGLHPTWAADAVLSAEGIDYVCIGEGERATLSLLEALETGQEPGRIDNIQRLGEPTPPLVAPLGTDEMPFLARDLLDEHHGVTHLSTQRGCPFPCAYCAARSSRDLYRGRRPGARMTVGRVIDELVSVRRHGPLSYVIFLDDTFTIGPAWLREFCQRFRPEVGVGFSLHARPDTVDADLLERLADTGCKHIVFGVESGSERVRREIMDRDIPQERIVEAFALARDAGLITTANYMLGLPGERAEDVEATLELNERLAPDDFGYFVYYPYPGTRLHDLCVERGYLPANWLELPAVHNRSILALPDLSQDDIVGFYERFTQARQKTAELRGGVRLDNEQRAAIRKDLRRDAEFG